MLAALVTSAVLRLAQLNPTPVTPLTTQDTPAFWSQEYRDSSAKYAGRLVRYQQQLLSYDLGMAAAVLPIAGEAYVDKPTTGVLFSAVRLGAATASVVGVVRLITGSQNTGLNVGLVAGGIVGWFFLKWWEISDVMHSISAIDEELVEKWKIATADIEPGSIRYPTREWPDWVTTSREERHPERVR